MSADDRPAASRAFDEEALRRLIGELDRLVPREGACVFLEPYGGAPDEGRFIGNRLGYLRFGVEILKGGLTAPTASEPAQHPVTVDLAEILHEDSVISFDEFVLDADLSHVQAGPGGSNTSGLLWGIGCIAACCLMATLATIGLISVIRSLL